MFALYFRSFHSQSGCFSRPRKTVLTAEQCRSIHVLVVDDEDTILESCVHVLEQEGYHVRGIDRGSEALRVLEEGHVQIALIDLYMSGVSGMELMRAALDANPECAVIIITGRPSAEMLVETVRQGARDFLPKPFSATQLRVLVGGTAHDIVSRGHVGQRLEALGSPATDPSRDVSPTFICTVFQGRGTESSDLLQPMFDKWAKPAGVSLFPGTIYLVAEHALAFPRLFIDLRPFVTQTVLSTGRDKQPGFSPRLYPVALAGCLPGWIYRWSADDVRLGFLGRLGVDAGADRVIEVITTLHVKSALGVAKLSLRFAGM
jgi:CheY-like chemotaxis protein